MKMSKNLTERCREELLRRRGDLTERLSRADTGVADMNDALQPEREEMAQREQLSGISESLKERDQTELRAIDGALARIDAGTYGVCANCGRQITLDRLTADGTTALCAECSAAGESSLAPEADEPPPRGELPPDLDILSPEELQEHLMELIRENGTVDVEELRINVRDGVIYLDGAIPSEAEHEVLLTTLSDVAGVREIVDHLEIQRLAWERSDRSVAQDAQDYQPGPARSGEPYAGTEDPVLTEDEGLNYEPPVSPPTPFNRPK
jgi:RNA polymerase-binding protein DksA